MLEVGAPRILGCQVGLDVKGPANVHAIIAAAPTASRPAESNTRRRTAMPSRTQIAASVSPISTSADAMRTTSRRIRPCWNSATIAVGVYAAARSQMPP